MSDSVSMDPILNRGMKIEIIALDFDGHKV
jgi:hypothetical protein